MHKLPFDRYRFYTNNVFCNCRHDDNIVIFFPSKRLAIHILKKSRIEQWHSYHILFDKPIRIGITDYCIISTTVFKSPCYYMMVKLDIAYEIYNELNNSHVYGGMYV